MKKCKCGCGLEIPENHTWVKGHHGKGKKRTEKEIQNMKKGISKEERKRRSERTKKRWQDGVYDFMNGETNPACDPEVKRKISDANRKRIVTKETKEKIRKSKLGKPGNPVSDKRKKEYSKRMKIDNPMFRKEVLQNHPILRSGRYFISKGEEKLKILFTKMKLSFIHQHQLKKEKGYYTVDFFFPKYEKIIEFDGHASHVENKNKDIERDIYIKNRYRYSTLRILPQDLNNTNRDKLILKIKEFLKCPN